jgi:Flp pilus assembly pilin Flp
MTYRVLGRAHAWMLALRDERGQGTVEYVGLILLIAAVIAGVVAMGATLKGGGIAETIVNKLKEAVDGAGDAKKLG